MPNRDALVAGYISSVLPGAGVLPDIDPATLPAAARSAADFRIMSGTLPTWNAEAARVGYCANPIKLRGSSTTTNSTTGEVIDSFSSDDAAMGVVHVPCGNRRADKCASCARLYARDTFEMISTGLIGGKTVPESVADAPLVFATLTAPSFGHVHGLRNGGKACRPHVEGKCPHGQSRACQLVHLEGDTMLGQPLCWKCYDWTSAVVWQWHAPELWRRATIALRRALATHLNVTVKELRDLVSLQYAKVAEFQARGLVHFHALIRVDGPDGPGSRASINADTLAILIRQAVKKVEVTADPVDDADVSRVLRFGTQLDTKIVRTGQQGSAIDDARTSDVLVPEQVAGYLAKYSTKSVSDNALGAPASHLRRMTSECLELSARGAKAEVSPYFLLGKWAKMLGFRGHFSTKSRSYSVTLGKLRTARARFARLKAESDRAGQPLDVADLEARLLADDEATTLVVGSWEFTGTGWPRTGERELALAAAARAREYAQWKTANKNA